MGSFNCNVAVITEVSETLSLVPFVAIIPCHLVRYAHFDSIFDKHENHTAAYEEHAPQK